MSSSRELPTAAGDPSPTTTLDERMRRRVIVDTVAPQIDAGRFPIKRTAGERLEVTAHVFADGHDLLAGVLKHRPAGPGRGRSWHEVPLKPLGNDEWTAAFDVGPVGAHEYTIEAWIDRFGSWVRELGLKSGAGQDVSSELLEGAALIETAAQQYRDGGRGARSETGRLLEIAELLRSRKALEIRVAAASDPDLRRMMDARPDRRLATAYERVLRVTVDSRQARFSSWYEMFPRSCTTDPARAGTLRDAEARLPELASLGFDVVYLPPVHPIGTTHRKGRNNALSAQPGDPGSPWAIGSLHGGHTSIDPGLGTLDDFDRFVEVAGRLGLDVALDIAFQASPDHPWVREHPAWFRQRPDGSIKYAENPPKKYQDIYPLDFDSTDWRAMWEALRDVFRFWRRHGVRIFRVDNPHTKSFPFWEWCIAEVARDHPDVVFLAEAFTRPKVMRYLAKIGFNQSYTYFTWRNTAAELRDYLTELTTTDMREYFRPNFFANTPDILHDYLQRGGRPAFQVRLILAATLSASYGIYSGFELCENVAVRPGSEEYLDSEKYQIKVRDYDAPGNLKALISRLNSLRRQETALQRNDTLLFHETDNPALLCYSKGDDSGRRIVAVVNTDTQWMHHGFLTLPAEVIGAPADTPYDVEDLLDEARYRWQGARNYVRLDPRERVAHLFVVRP
jgi:starch synthase (maltosyl-transferring)